jgi:hypothetical protein
MTGCASGPDRQFVTVASHVVVPAGKAIQLRSPVPLQTASDENEICLTPEAPYRVDTDRWAFAGPDGERIVVHVQLLGGGAQVELSGLSESGGDLCRTAVVVANIGGPFDVVQIRSSATLPLAKVEWKSTHK